MILRKDDFLPIVNKFNLDGDFDNNWKKKLIGEIRYSQRKEIFSSANSIPTEHTYVVSASDSLVHK